MGPKMKQDSDMQLRLDFEATVNQTAVVGESKIASTLRLIYSNSKHSGVELCTAESTLLFFKHDDKLFEPIISHARSLSW